VKIPKSLKIGSRNIKVLRLLSSGMGGHSGSYQDWTGIIRIANDVDMGKGLAEEALLHEIIECLNIKQEYKLEHRVIQGLGENLYQVLKDNKLYFGDE